MGPIRRAALKNSSRPQPVKSFLLKSRLIRWLNAQAKRHLQERKAKRSLAWYQQRAVHLGLETSRECVVKAARARLADRAAGRWPKQKGQLHVFLAFHVKDWEAILPWALSPFGRISVFDWTQTGFDHSSRDWLQQRDGMNQAMLAAFHRANTEQPIDVVVGYLSGQNTSRDTLRTMAEAGAAVFNFCWDDKLCFPGKPIGGRFPTPAEIASAVDLNLTNAPDSVVKYAVHGGLALFWPEAAHPEVHRPHETGFDFDVSFAGSCYGWRPAFIRQLAARGIEVECFGRGWPNGVLNDLEMVRLYSRSRINLGFSAIGYTKRLMCLKGRDFEVPMSGGLYLTQHNPELALVYRLGEEILTYNAVEDCARTIRELLAHPVRCEAVRERGRVRCLLEHTYEARWTEVLRLLNILE